MFGNWEAKVTLGLMRMIPNRDFYGRYSEPNEPWVLNAGGGPRPLKKVEHSTEIKIAWSWFTGVAAGRSWHEWPKPRGMESAESMSAKRRKWELHLS